MLLSMTKLQYEEATHKLFVLSGEPDLQESYELTAVEAEELYDRFYYLKPADGRYEIQIDSKVRDILIGELENSIDILSGNIECGDDSLRGIRSSIGRVLKILRANADVEFTMNPGDA